MKILMTAGRVFLTGTELADAVMHYALALTKQQTADLVSIPTVDERGELTQVDLIIGWPAEITAGSAADRGDGEVIDVEAIVSLYDRAGRVGIARGLPFSDQELRELPQSRFDE